MCSSDLIIFHKHIRFVAEALVLGLCKLALKHGVLNPGKIPPEELQHLAYALLVYIIYGNKVGHVFICFSTSKNKVVYS